MHGFEALLASLPTCEGRHRNRRRCTSAGRITDVLTRQVYCRMHAPCCRDERKHRQRERRAVREIRKVAYGF